MAKIEIETTKKETKCLRVRLKCLFLFLDKKKSIDPYKVLGVDKHAIQRHIQEAFQELSFKYHPHVNKEKGAKEKFDQICDAYRILSDRYGDVKSDTNSGGGSYGDHGAFNVVVTA
ncbi:hypothetical protein AAC387_Pa01g4052 [Persea americana]